MRAHTYLMGVASVLFPSIVAGVLSRKFSDPPLSAHQIVSNQNYQLPLYLSSIEDGQSYTAKITDYCRIVFLADIEAGSPPQNFRASIDISFSEVLLPSSKCVTRDCSARYHHRYNSTESDTYRENGTAVNLRYGGVYSSGFKSRDTFWVAGLEVKHQEFEEATTWDISPFYTWDDMVDTVLGLSRLSLSLLDSNLRATGLWHNIIKQKLLKRNIFSLKLSKSPDIDGEIMFGAMNHNLFEGDLQTVKTIKAPHDPTSRTFGHGWQVPAQSLIFDDIEEDLSDYIAVFITNDAWFQIPYPLWEKLKEKCGAVEDPMGPDRVPCDKRSELPDLVIWLGNAGEEVAVTISAMDYILEMPTVDGKTACALPWGAHSIQDSNEPLYIVLGTAFLGGIYSVWDQDEATISFAKLKRDITMPGGKVNVIEFPERKSSESSSPFVLEFSSSL